MDCNNFFLLIFQMVANLKFIVTFVVNHFINFMFDLFVFLLMIVLVLIALVDIIIMNLSRVWFNFETIILLSRPLFQPVCISQCIQGVFSTATAGTNTGYHNSLIILFAYETVSEDHCQLAPSERYVLRIQVDWSYTLFQCQ